jgi:hypothetical protein
MNPWNTKLLRVLVPFHALSMIMHKRILGSVFINHIQTHYSLQVPHLCVVIYIQSVAGNNHWQPGDPMANIPPPVGENVAMQGRPQAPHYFDVAHYDMQVPVGYYHRPQPDVSETHLKRFLAFFSHRALFHRIVRSHTCIMMQGLLKISPRHPSSSRPRTFHL